MGALGEAELTLLLRNRTAFLLALLMPVAMVGLSWSSSREWELDGTGLSRGEAVLTGGIGLVLVLVVYQGLIPVYVARREERVLKRLRTGELTDAEILAGSALPSAALALAQCVVLVAAGAALLDVRAPAAAPLLVAGTVLGVVLLAALAAATAALTRTVESAQVTGMPLLMASVLGSGLFVPLAVLPDRVADACRMLPLTPVVELVTGGWLGGLNAAEAGRALALGMAWTAVAVFAVRRRFRWEPRA
ncbi:ABC transporter permease [Streptomyces sp. DSM 44917]|uniref:ABC transporter permease n=1 Tax=Streptomyces boetiae TaxID=3075541 RepID=A0ABU2LBN6_9ACTN|nr:ABC transporter permease [Streptomyces sp. DSM 44917]MDT0308979.1 ABC transporter permease [Streptomyces sp. DSM 44917]